MNNEYVKTNYKTITIIEKRSLIELMNSSVLNGFNEQDFKDVLAVFSRVCDRLCLMEE